MNKCYFFLFLVIIVSQSCSKKNTPVINDNTEYTIDWNAAADSSSSTLINSFWNASEKYFNSNNSGLKDFQYWPQAHALDVMIDAYSRNNNSTYKTTIDQWYDCLLYTSDAADDLLCVDLGG